MFTYHHGVVSVSDDDGIACNRDIRWMRVIHWEDSYHDLFAGSVTEGMNIHRLHVISLYKLDDVALCHPSHT